MKKGWIRVFSFGTQGIGWLPNTSSTKHQRFLKTLVHGAQRIIVAQMPFAENASRIARIKQILSKGMLLRIHHGTADVGINTSSPIIVSPGHEAGPSRSTHGTDIVLSHLCTLTGHGVQIGGPQNRVSLKSKIPITLIIGNHDDHVGA